MANIFTNLSGNIDAQQAVDSYMTSPQYKLTYYGEGLGDGKSFLIIGCIGGSSYFFPLQFLGSQEVILSAELNGVVTCKLNGNAKVSGLTLATYTQVTEADNEVLQLVRNESSYWDRIKKITNDVGKVRTDMLNGLINMTVNAFANQSGTITQKDGIMTFLNGSTPETSTAVVQICGGAIRIANSKKENGEWDWKTAISGAGINAETIIAKSLATVDFSSANIQSCDITTADLKSCTLKGGELYIGDNPDNLSIFTGCIIQQNGFIKGYYRGTETFSLVHTSSGRLRLYSPTTGKSIVLDSYTGELYADAGGGITIQNGVDFTNVYGTKINTRIEIKNGEINLITFNNDGTQNGTVNITGNLNVRGDISCWGLSQQG